MPLFQLDKKALTPIQQSDFPNEKALQNLVEANIGAVFNCRLVASEFSTGSKHAGRIDTLALSEDSNPVIIEYKRVASSELINQSLFYLNWLHDHHGDFEIAAQKALGASVEIDWSDIREPLRDCRRLQHLRGWSHVKGNEVFSRGPGAGGAARERARG
ncbi:MAG TPA: hypothetical protein VFK39_09755 [Gemmatimonadaceae bacterium]|nr:hypothetical protein [Gemmatimonadaceae bacterium]